MLTAHYVHIPGLLFAWGAWKDFPERDFPVMSAFVRV